MSDATTPTDDGRNAEPQGPPGPEAYVIPADLAQATLNYLAAQPYREVFTLVQAFEALEPLRGERTAQEAPGDQ